MSGAIDAYEKNGEHKNAMEMNAIDARGLIEKMRHLNQLLMSPKSYVKIKRGGGSP